MKVLFSLARRKSSRAERKKRGKTKGEEEGLGKFYRHKHFKTRLNAFLRGLERNFFLFALSKGTNGRGERSVKRSDFVVEVSRVKSSRADNDSLAPGIGIEEAQLRLL